MAKHDNISNRDRAAGHDAAKAGDRPQALAGIKVLDMSRVIAGPLAGQTLADLGADVIKIERREGGEDLRSLGPPWMKDPDGRDSEESTYFQSANRGKRSVTIDFAKPEGSALVRRLAEQSDVLLENFRTGTLARYGLGYADIATINPRLIYCSLTGFGQNGPYADRSGYDYLVQAMGGFMSMTGHPEPHPGAGPMRAGVPIADITAGNNAVTAILAALFHRERGGNGQHIDIALFDAQIGMLMNAMSGWLNGGVQLPRTGTDHPTAVPNGVFSASDGHLLISTFNDREFARLAEAMGHPEWAEDKRFVRSRDRLLNRTLLVDVMRMALQKATRAEWMERLNAAKVSCGPINEMDDIERDPQVAARGLVISLEHKVKGTVRVVASPLRLSGTPVRYDLPPPLAGEHTDVILTERLSLTPDEIDALRQQEII